ncbi:tetratricopeptide repeat protein [Baekduia soli]|uniref:Tetratricopeptide repeat protein n=1 Tax=Baekduia soli TaxID=496014 RepID=A0A5B8U271_9ACTN|nr:tetratricopeptide repeat protein [Baekduia soli]QEC47144.1 tetratricopeptide repeat protein [Baekduia soli]
MSDEFLIRGQHAEQAGDAEAAETLYRRALDGGEPHAGYFLGELLIELGRPEEAITLLEAAAGDGDAHLPLGNARWDLDDLDGAEEQFRLAADLGQPAGLHNLGLLLHDRDRVDEAVPLLRESVAAGHTEPRLLAEALADLGAQLQDEDRLDEAEAVLREALEGGATEAYVYLSSVLARLGEDEEADRVLRAGADLGVPSAELQLGNVLSDDDPASSDAEALYRRAIEHGEVGGHNNLGVLLWDAGRLDEAEAELRVAIGLGDEIAQQNLDGLLAERGHTNGRT